MFLQNAMGVKIALLIIALSKGVQVSNFSANYAVKKHTKRANTLTVINVENIIDPKHNAQDAQNAKAWEQFDNLDVFQHENLTLALTSAQSIG